MISDHFAWRVAGGLGGVPVTMDSPQEDMGLVNQFLDTKWKTLFMIEVKTIDDVPMLAPVGVLFTCPSKSVPDNFGKIIILEREGDFDDAQEVPKAREASSADASVDVS